MTERYNMTCDQGATFIREIAVTDADGNPVNYTGFEAEMQVRKTHGDPTSVVDLTTGNGRITIVGAAGQVKIMLTDEETAQITPRSYVYDLLLVTPTGEKDRILEGQFIVTPGVTRLGGG